MGWGIFLGGGVFVWGGSVGFFFGWFGFCVVLFVHLVVAVGGFLFGLVIFSPSGLRNNSPSWKAQMTKVTTFDMISILCHLQDEQLQFV